MHLPIYLAAVMFWKEHMPATYTLYDISDGVEGDNKHAACSPPNSVMRREGAADLDDLM